MIAPGIGTAIGAGIGAIAGAVSGFAMDRQERKAKEARENALRQAELKKKQEDNKQIRDYYRKRRMAQGASMGAVSTQDGGNSSLLMK